MRQFAAKILLLLLMSVPLCLDAEEPSASHEAFDYSSFSGIPILHEGRIKPLDSFARAMYRHISGRSSPADASAIAWLAQVFFAPQDAMGERIFSLRDSELIPVLSLPPRSGSDYSFRELAAAFGAHQSMLEAIGNKDKKLLTPQEKELIRLYANVNDFADMAGTFSLFTPLDIDEATLKMPAIHAPVTYYSLLKIRKELESKEDDTRSRKKDRVESYTPDELGIARLTAYLRVMQALERNTALVRVIPPAWEDSEEWLSPWAVIEKGAGSPHSTQLFAQWQQLAASYRQSNSAQWQAVSQALLEEGLKGQAVRPFALTCETLYNTLNLLNAALTLYAAGFALAVTGLLRNSRRWLAASYGMLLLGAALHGAAILMRMTILLRPPVSTLYESMIFVSFVAMVFFLWLERRRKAADGLLIGSMLSCLLLMAANVFAGDSDTLEVLVAVLNTNFWLATHVVCITTGYGSSLVAGMIAHLYLFRRAVGKTPQADLMGLQRRIHSVALVALLFTAVGTMLGGIWADQSWGRFWGWDPKENGALWIVLWLIWLVHGRIAGQLGHLGFAVATALINIVVALAWVGVNLLSVGLHSYGFTDTAANGLLAFCAGELAFIGITLFVSVWQPKVSV